MEIGDRTRSVHLSRNAGTDLRTSSSYACVMIMEPEVLRCPNCGAALELVDGRCRWCHDPVRMKAVVAPRGEGRDAEAHADDDDPGDDTDDHDDDPVVRADDE